jgi:hypothetical protein
VLDDRYSEDVKDEILASFDELSEEEIIPGLVRAIRILSLKFPNPGQVIDEVIRMLEDEDD